MSRRGWPVWMRATDIADLLRLSAPIAVSRAAVMIMALTDAIVLGRNAPGELPYVLNSWLPIGVSLGFGMGILIGVQVITSELMGRGETHQTGRVFRRGLVTAIALGVALTALVYWSAAPLFNLVFEPEIADRTIGVTKILALGLAGHMLTQVCGTYLEALRRPLIVTAIMYGSVLINLVIDLALVAGWWGMPQMGAEGVAWATTGTRWLMTAAFLLVVFLMTPAAKSSEAAPADEGKRQLTVGLGAAVSNVAEWGGFNFTYIIATWISLAANTIYGLATQVMAVAFMAFLGIGTATSVRVAEHYGRSDREGVRDASRLGIVATVIVGVVIGLIIWTFRDQISLGMVDKSAMVDGLLIAPALAGLLAIIALGIVFDGLQATGSMALRAQDIIWAPTFIHIGSFFLFMIPLGYWLGLVKGYGPEGMAWAAVAGVFIAGILQLALLQYKTARRT